MEHLVLVGLGLVVGVSLGVLVMALLAAADRDQLPEPRPARTHTLGAARSGAREPSWAGLGASRAGGAVLRNTESTHEVAGRRASAER